MTIVEQINILKYYVDFVILIMLSLWKFPTINNVKKKSNCILI